jgi:hypothetical protein
LEHRDANFAEETLAKLMTQGWDRLTSTIQIGKRKKV